MTARHARWLLVVLHLPVTVIPVWYTGFGVAGYAGRDLAVAVVFGLVLGGLQLRHSLAASRDTRPRGWAWTLAALIAIVYLPLLLLDWWPNWQAAMFSAGASALMLLRGWVRIGVFAGMTAFAVVAELASDPLDSVVGIVFAVLYGVVAAVPPVIIYLAARLVAVLGELESTRARLAEAAVAQERLRLSRDLHDLFGQSLSAISLKGGLALRLLPDDPDGAREEITGLTGVARDTLRTMRAISRDEHAVSLATEARGAVALLATAGARTTIDVDTAGLSEGAQRIFAWAVREGVTNMLRHSEVRCCSIVVSRQAGSARLEIVNDGVREQPSSDGNGLTGLAARATAMGGSLISGQRDGEFRVVVEIPADSDWGNR
ncbi:two-component system sensor histidine kinase DesK [Kibdelosporangium banguiense]|uniref:Two-component system sensor histidine kinase DesK n=1 Tax=Kibdelosporangium banguiense TaxID=1365924 RepID=A0ABS4TZZ1_9PSEU|nr:histidine kinase [Kibdelosporangium banguiense]MBP2329946.1 two-component system sensor histidine kinase DesK [Kibdelosporangium banguiense]